MVEIVGQHACLTAAAYPWYYAWTRQLTAGVTVSKIFGYHGKAGREHL
jgi:hypothetical protein